MNPVLKRILLVLGLFMTTVVFAFLLWYFFFRTPAAPAPTPTPTPEAQLPGRKPGQPTPVTEQGAGTGQLPTSTLLPAFETAAPIASAPKTLMQNPVTNVAVSGNGAAFYDPSTGTFSRVDENGNIIKLSDRTFFGVSNVTWSPQTTKAVLEFPDGSNILYNFSENTQVTLPKHWEGFGFSPDGNRIAGKSIGLDAENRWLFVSNADGTESQAVAQLGNNASKVQVAWSPNNQMIAFSKTGEPRDGLSQEVYPVGMHDENFKSLIVPGFGFAPKWSPSGTSLLYSVYNKNDGYRPTLWISSPEGGDRRPLNLQTWVDKCSFQSANILFCAAPTTLDEGAALEPSLADRTPDSIYRIDLQTGTQTTIVPATNAGVSSIAVSENGKYLFYTDKVTNMLTQVELK